MEKEPSEQKANPLKLKPVVYTSSTYKRGAPNRTQQMVLLKALQVTSDPNELRKLIGVRTVSEVYRTLDKLAMRKEYHRALDENGISFDYIVKNLRSIVESAEKDGDKLKAIQMLLKSVGMDKYEGDANAAAGTWEEALIDAAEKQKAEMGGVTTKEMLEAEYTVSQPEVPEYVKKIQQDESDLAKSLYED